MLAIENFGATDIIEITRDPVPEKGPKTFMVPMIPAAVLEWDETPACHCGSLRRRIAG